MIDIYLKESISELDAVAKKLESGEYLTSENQSAINFYADRGSIKFRRCDDKDGSISVFRYYELETFDENMVAEHGVAVAILVAAAHDLGEEWIKSQTWPRYETNCRAPSCGRGFYSGRCDAKNCPPASHGEACRLEWIRYKRWIEKQRLDAETKWADQSLQQQFSEQDVARTEIRDEQISRAHGIGVRQH